MNHAFADTNGPAGWMFWPAPAPPPPPRARAASRHSGNACAFRRRRLAFRHAGLVVPSGRFIASADSTAASDLHWHESLQPGKPRESRSLRRRMECSGPANPSVRSCSAPPCRSTGLASGAPGEHAMNIVHGINWAAGASSRLRVRARRQALKHRDPRHGLPPACCRCVGAPVPSTSPRSLVALFAAMPFAQAPTELSTVISRRR